MRIKSRQGLASGDDLACPGIYAQQPLEFGLTFDNDPPVPPTHEWQVSDELKGIPQTLFSVKQQRATLQWAAVPQGGKEVSTWQRRIVHLPSPFVFVPALRPIPPRQQRKRKIVMGPGKAWFEDDRLVIDGDGLVKLPLVFQGITEIAVRFRIIGPEDDGLTTGGDGLVELPFVFQGIAEVAMGFGVAGPEGDGLTIGGNGPVKLPRLLQGNSEVIVCC